MSPKKPVEGRARAMSMKEAIYWQTAPKRFCQYCVRRFSFWIAVGVFALVEPILCSQHQTTLNLFLQVIVLAISSFLYIIQLIGVASTEWDRIQAVQALGGGVGSILILQGAQSLTIVKLFMFFTAEGEFLVEGAMLLAGWILIFWHPGLAILRCFRVFRLLWFYEVHVFKVKTTKWLSPYFGEGFVKRAFKVFKFAIKALSALGDEIFRLTPETRGGLLLIMMIFYSAFVLGAAIYVETNGEGTNCESIGMCTYTLMRLTFFDGNGFDFAFYLVGGYKILFFIVMLYMCITSFGIINGLVGIFGTLFATASSAAFEEEDDEGRYGKLEEEDYSSEEEENEPCVPVLESLEEGRNETENDSYGGDKILPLGRFNESQKKSALDLMAAVEGKAPPMSEKQIESHLKEALGTNHVSHFTVQEFQNMQAKHSPRDGVADKTNEAPTPSGKKRLTIKEVAEKVSGKHKPKPATTPLFGEENDTFNQEVRTKPKPVGMFGGGALKKEKSTLGHGIGGGSNAHLDTRLMTSHMSHMQQKIDQQQEIIMNMYNHILHIEHHLTGSSTDRPPVYDSKQFRPASGNVARGYKTHSVAEIVPFPNTAAPTRAQEQLRMDDAESER